MDRNGRASAHLDHYLTGKGGDLKVDLGKVIVEDEGVRKKLYLEIMTAMSDGKLEGSVPIAQNVYKNHDWLYAIGGMNINWKAGAPIAAGKVRVGFRNKYRWHPEDNDRVSHCVHQAASRLQQNGAMEYFMEGSAIITPSVNEWQQPNPQN
jgi:hypothetical protein